MCKRRLYFKKIPPRCYTLTWWQKDLDLGQWSIAQPQLEFGKHSLSSNRIVNGGYIHHYKKIWTRSTMTQIEIDVNNYKFYQKLERGV